jgi:hypothetical protein
VPKNSSLRKFKDWVKKNGISKNIQRDDMFIIQAKRQARLVMKGKKTIVYKDGRIVDDDRIDRFAERSCPTEGFAAYFSAGKSRQSIDYMLQ